MKAVKHLRTKGRAIQTHCLDCSGGTTKERLLCNVFDCPLWEYRTGSFIGSSQYNTSIRAAFNHCPEEWKELERQGITKDYYLPRSSALRASWAALGEKTPPPPARDKGKRG